MAITLVRTAYTGAKKPTHACACVGPAIDPNNHILQTRSTDRQVYFAKPRAVNRGTEMLTALQTPIARSFWRSQVKESSPYSDKRISLTLYSFPCRSTPVSQLSIPG